MRRSTSAPPTTHGELGHACNGSWNRILDDPHVGVGLLFRPDLPVAPAEQVDGRTIIAPGMEFKVESVFRDWNCVPGLTIFYGYVPDTGYHTHLSEEEFLDRRRG